MDGEKIIVEKRTLEEIREDREKVLLGSRHRLLNAIFNHEPCIQRINRVREEIRPLLNRVFRNTANNLKEAVGGNPRNYPHAGYLQKHFFQAAERGDVVSIIAYLLEGYPVNDQNRFGETALHVAAAVNAVDITRVLVSTGECDYLLRDNGERLAVELAISEADNWAISKLLGKKARQQGIKQGVRVTRRP